MKSTLASVLGTDGFPGYSFFLGTQWTFAIIAPSGTGRPLLGIPAFKASIILGLPTITAITPPFWLSEIVSQLSYPRSSENAMPPGTFKVYLSWVCAWIA